MSVYCYPVSRNSSYTPLIFAGITDRYQPVHRQDGSLADAIAHIDAGIATVVHIHWEEFVLDACRSDAEADEATREFIRLIGAVRARNGAIVWTVHNELPHMIRFHRQFLEIRAELAAHASAILVHDTASIHVLSAQVALDRSTVTVLPHPSYLDRHEDEATLRAGLGRGHERRVQGFGWIRRQKGFGELIEMLPADFLTAHGAYIRISGDDGEAAAVMAEHPERGDVQWDVRHVPDADVPRLLRSAACVAIPYERVLTSGVALLAMSVGALIVAVDVPPLRELLPVESRGFLYPRGDAAAFRRIIAEILTLPDGDRTRIVAANLEVARQRHPRIIARALAALYDRLMADRTPA